MTTKIDRLTNHDDTLRAKISLLHVAAGKTLPAMNTTADAIELGKIIDAAVETIIDQHEAKHYPLAK